MRCSLLETQTDLLQVADERFKGGEASGGDDLAEELDDGGRDGVRADELPVDKSARLSGQTSEAGAPSPELLLEGVDVLQHGRSADLLLG
jgi:hypothetical protein